LTSDPEKLHFRSKWTGGIILAKPAIEGKNYEVAASRKGQDGRAVHTTESQTAQLGEWYIHISSGPKLVSLAFLLLSFEPADEAATAAVEASSCKENA
jgi:hypothetical protein